MIRPLAALIRQGQDFFLAHLVGIYRWDEVRIDAPEKNEKPAPILNSRGRKRRPEGTEGKYHQRLVIEFSIWRLVIEGPNERPPLGWLTLDGYGELEGPLDAATWKRFGEHIRTKHEEIKNVA